MGIDAHRFSDDPDRTLVLGGVRIDGSRGLEGHSDADAIAHACADALLGAVGLGDIGQHFPDTDERWAGADSISLLRAVAGLVRAEGWEPGNLDCTVVLEAPRMAPHREAMQQRLSEAVGADVHVKATRAEQMGALGRGEGVACWAVALVTAAEPSS
jgi:2-C-methyl-D-erythritol 2,4-cyclodiphosphate synthase